jgi:hypothetical protein
MGWVVNAVPQPLQSQERPGTHCIVGWVGPRAGLEWVRKILITPRFDLRTFQPVASCYTDWAIPAQFIRVNFVKYTLPPNVERMMACFVFRWSPVQISAWPPLPWPRCSRFPTAFPHKTQGSLSHCHNRFLPYSLQYIILWLSHNSSWDNLKG